MPSSAVSRLDVKSRTSSRPARSETQVKRNVRSKILKRPTETEHDDGKNGGGENENEEWRPTGNEEAFVDVKMRIEIR